MSPSCLPPDAPPIPHPRPDCTPCCARSRQRMPWKNCASTSSSPPSNHSPKAFAVVGPRTLISPLTRILPSSPQSCANLSLHRLRPRPDRISFIATEPFIPLAKSPGSESTSGIRTKIKRPDMSRACKCQSSLNQDRDAFLARHVLVVDPAISLFQTDPQRNARLPTQVLLDLGVVAVAAVHTLRSGKIVNAFELRTGDLFRNIDQLVDRHHLRRSQVERFNHVRVHDHLRALEAIVDVHEAARLVAVTPDRNFRVAFRLCLNYLAADSSRSFFAATRPRSVWTINVVIPRHPRTKTVIFAEVTAHALGKEFLPSVTVLGIGRIRIFFSQSRIVVIALLAGVINAS